jgi:predicted phosphodiesterase
MGIETGPGIRDIDTAKELQIKTIQLPLNGSYLFFSDAHLNSRRYDPVMENLMIGLVRSHDQAFVVGDLGDSQFGSAAELVKVYGKLFETMRDENAFLFDGNHDPWSWWGETIKDYIDDDHRVSRLRAEIGEMTYDIQHGNEIIPAMHEIYTWIPEHWLLGYISLYGGTALRRTLEITGLARLLLRTGMTFLLPPDNVRLHRWVEANLNGEVGIFGHTHSAEISPALLNPGEITPRHATYLTITNGEPELHRVRHQEP